MKRVTAMLLVLLVIVGCTASPPRDLPEGAVAGSENFTLLPLTPEPVPVPPMPPGSDILQPIDFGEGYRETALEKGEVIAQISCGANEEKTVLEYSSLVKKEYTMTVHDCARLATGSFQLAVASSVGKIFYPLCNCDLTAVRVFDSYLKDDLRIVFWNVDVTPNSDISLVLMD